MSTDVASQPPRVWWNYSTEHTVKRATIVVCEFPGTSCASARATKQVVDVKLPL